MALFEAKAFGAHHQSGQGVHGARPQVVNARIEASDQRVDDERRILGKVENVRKLVDAFKCSASNLEQFSRIASIKSRHLHRGKMVNYQ